MSSTKGEKKDKIAEIPMEVNKNSDVTEEDPEITARIKLFSETLSGSHAAISRELGMSSGYFLQVVKGKRVSARMLKALVVIKKLNPTWLFTGVGNMRLLSAEEEQDKDEKIAFLERLVEDLKNRVETQEKMIQLLQTENNRLYKRYSDS